MITLQTGRAACVAVLALIVASWHAWAADDPLPSWNDGAAKSAIVDFVEAVTADGEPDYVPPDERIATFDNDRTLWVEQPYYTQLAFALDRIRALAPEHPEWREQQPFKAVLDNDLEALKTSGIKGVMQLVMASHAGMTTGGAIPGGDAKDHPRAAAVPARPVHRRRGHRGTPGPRGADRAQSRYQFLVSC